MRTVDRCWCDFSAGGFFEPFNVTHWEYVSVQRLKEDLERQPKMVEASLMEEEPQQAQNSNKMMLAGHRASTMPQTTAPEPTSSITTLKSTSASTRDIRSIFRLFRYAFKSDPEPFQLGDIPTTRPSVLDTVTTPMPSPPPPEENRPLIRKEYDLRPYGLGILIDFGWTR